MNRLFKTLISAGIGAGAMFLFDPDRGRRRRSLAIDKVDSLKHSGSDMLEKATHDLRNRAAGMMARSSAALRIEKVGDELLTARVRAEMGHVTSHPHAIHVTSRDGVVSLSGPVLTEEIPRLLARIRGVRGVRQIRNELEGHVMPDIPALQGGNRDISQESARATPAQRLVSGVLGGGLALFGIVRRGFIGTVVAGIGAGLFSRAVVSTSPEINAPSGLFVGPQEKSTGGAARTSGTGPQAGKSGETARSRTGRSQSEKGRSTAPSTEGRMESTSLPDSTGTVVQSDTPDGSRTAEG